MGFKSANKILSTIYQREKEISGVYSLLEELSLLTARSREVIEKAKQEDKEHASFLIERLRQLGVEVQKLKEEAKKTIEELKEALEGIDKEEEKLNLLMKVLIKIKKDEITRFRSYLELEEKDEFTQQLLERISNSETHHILRLEVLNLIKKEKKEAQKKRGKF